MNFLIIAQSGFIPELGISVRAGERIPIGHPFIRQLIPYSTTPDILKDAGHDHAVMTDPDQNQNEGQEAVITFTQDEIDALRKLAKEAHIKNYHTMKPETILKRLEEQHHD